MEQLVTENEKFRSSWKKSRTIGEEKNESASESADDQMKAVRRHKTKGKPDQVASGDLNLKNGAQSTEKTVPEVTIPVIPRDFRNKPQSIEGVDPNRIETVRIIKDSVEPVISLYPILVKTPTSFYCLDGFPLVEQALNEKMPTITCRIFHVEEVSELDLAYGKVGRRIMPAGGKEVYPETIRNLETLILLTSQSMKTPVINSHGGDRRSKKFISNKEDQVFDILAQGLGLSRSTLLKYRNHGEYINDDTMEALVQGRVDKAFFEQIQKVKRKMLTNLRSDRATEDEITRQISAAVLFMQQDPRNIKDLWRSLNQAPAQETTESTDSVTDEDEDGWEETVSPDEDQKAGLVADEDEKPQNLLHPFKGNQDAPEVESLKDQMIRNRGAVISERMKIHFSNSALNLRDIRRAITTEIQNLMSLLAQINLGETSSSGADKTDG